MKNRAIVLNLGSLFVALFLIVILTVPVFAAKPIILPPYTLSIAENAAPGNTTTPNKINAFDAEPGLLEFQKLGGDGMAMFDIGFNTGIVTLAAGQSLDYETKKSYTLDVQVHADGLLLLAVRDSGSGIAPEIQARVFEPFFTTRGQGTGLGLAIALGVARAHGGTIKVSSVPDSGSEFVIMLPVADATAVDH